MIRKGPFIFAILWLILISILFFLPGSAIPKNDWLGKIQFDKWVHVGFFALLAWLWSRSLVSGKGSQFIWIFFMAGLYGLMVEVIQDQWVLNRSFDSGDLVADVAGSFIGCWFAWRTYIKK